MGCIKATLGAFVHHGVRGGCPSFGSTCREQTSTPESQSVSLAVSLAVSASPFRRREKQASKYLVGKSPLIFQISKKIGASCFICWSGISWLAGSRPPKTLYHYSLAASVPQYFRAYCSPGKFHTTVDRAYHTTKRTFEAASHCEVLVKRCPSKRFPCMVDVFDSQSIYGAICARSH